MTLQYAPDMLATVSDGFIQFWRKLGQVCADVRKDLDQRCRAHKVRAYKLWLCSLPPALLAFNYKRKMSASQIACLEILARPL